MKRQATTIDEVLEMLDTIIADSTRENDRLGFFAYIYRRTTAQIKEAILDKQFADNERMEKFDVYFANKYLAAYFDFQKGLPVSQSWAAAFQAKHDKLTILQHIILGMNAHINLDLGLSAAEFTRGENIEGLKNDFMKVNEILNSLVDELQLKVGRVSRMMFLLDWVGKRSDEAVMNFSMVKARQQAWNFAVSLSVSPEEGRKVIIEEVDGFTGKLGQLVKSPPGKMLAFVLKIVSYFEDKNVGTIIDKLEA